MCNIPCVKNVKYLVVVCKYIYITCLLFQGVIFSLPTLVAVTSGKTQETQDYTSESDSCTIQAIVCFPHDGAAKQVLSLSNDKLTS